MRKYTDPQRALADFILCGGAIVVDKDESQTPVWQVGTYAEVERAAAPATPWETTRDAFGQAGISIDDLEDLWRKEMVS